jgi:hypothetical protein
MRRPLRIARPLAAVAAAVLLAGLPARAAAQSLFAQHGLGLVTDPQSARSAGLGGVTLGLPGLEIAWNDPAGSVGLPAAGLLVGAQLDDFQARYSGRTTDGSTARFPLVLAAFPFGQKWAVTAGFGSFLDQRWAVQNGDTILIGTDSVGVIDRVSSDGGVSRVRVGAGYRIAPHLSLGVGMDLYTGGTQRVAGRIFPGEVTPGCCTARWTYSGTGTLASLDWYPSPALRVAVSASAGGTLKAKPRATSADSTSSNPTGAGELGEARRYKLPATLAVGASGRVSANTLIAASAEWAGWSSLDPSLASAGGARDSWSAHGGLEWDALSILGRPVPLRLGGRYQALPFRAEAASGAAPWTSERAFSVGTGLVLGGGATRGDVSVERGRRGSANDGLNESFWRINFSVSVLGQ